MIDQILYTISDKAKDFTERFYAGLLETLLTDSILYIVNSWNPATCILNSTEATMQCPLWA